MDKPFVIGMTVTGLCLIAFFSFLGWVFVTSNAQEAAFKARCDKAHGQVFETRDSNMCLHGNTILFVSS
jgi:hypothetical protein